MTQASTPLVAMQREANIAIVTLDNPKRRNALSPAMRDELLAVLDGALQDRAVRAIVLTGAGNAFCAGGDISTMSPDSTLLENRHRMARYHELLRMLAAGSKPVVAAVEGVAFGAGMSLALACDHIVAAANSRFCTAFARVGLIPDVGMYWTLPQRVGMAKAKELIALTPEFDGQEAVRLGVANEVVPSGSALVDAMNVARRYAQVAPAAFAFAKAAFADGSVNTLEGAARAETDSQPTLRKSADHLRAVQAFMEKRIVSFEGD